MRVMGGRRSPPSRNWMKWFPICGSATFTASSAATRHLFFSSLSCSHGFLSKVRRFSSYHRYRMKKRSQGPATWLVLCPATIPHHREMKDTHALIYWEISICQGPLVLLCFKSLWLLCRCRVMSPELFQNLFLQALRSLYMTGNFFVVQCGSKEELDASCPGESEKDH